jgi:hypothetical protein
MTAAASAATGPARIAAFSAIVLADLAPRAENAVGRAPSRAEERP